MQKKMLRKKTKTESAARIAALLEAVEYGLIRAVTKCDDLTVKAQGDLVSMQRRLAGDALRGRGRGADRRAAPGGGGLQL
jgi:hypothetical protein